MKKSTGSYGIGMAQGARYLKANANGKIESSRVDEAQNCTEEHTDMPDTALSLNLRICQAQNRCIEELEGGRGAKLHRRTY